MNFEVVTIKEYARLKGLSDKSGAVNKIIQSGEFPAEWLKVRKSGGSWLIYVLKSWYDNAKINYDEQV